MIQVCEAELQKPHALVLATMMKSRYRVLQKLQVLIYGRLYCVVYNSRVKNCRWPLAAFLQNYHGQAFLKVVTANPKHSHEL